jgi:hypothetical protein
MIFRFLKISKNDKNEIENTIQCEMSSRLAENQSKNKN